MPAKMATDPQHKKEIVAMGALQHENVVGLKDIVYQPPSQNERGRIFLILEVSEALIVYCCAPSMPRGYNARLP